MTDKSITVAVNLCAPGELPAEDLALVEAAKAATYRSYAPYSGFSVGAAIRLGDGTVVAGSNQENVAYPSGMCAERTAAYYAHSAHPQQPFAAIAVAARDTSGAFTTLPVTPCGACRQALLQYELVGKRPVRVLLYGTDGVYCLDSIASMLPLSFSSFE